MLEVDATGGCWEAFTVRFVIEENDAESTSNGVMNVVSYWWQGTGAPSSQANAMTGNFNWGTNQFTIVFQRPAGAGDFHGDGVVNQRLAGVFEDPNGVFAVLEPGRSRCTASAGAFRLSPRLP